MHKNIQKEGTWFTVICKRCGKVFNVVRNYGGGIRRADDESINPAKCYCGSLQLEIY